MTNNARKRSFWKVFRTIWICLGLIFVGWMVYSYQAKDLPPDTFVSDGQVKVSNTADVISFTPNKTYTRVLIFYPGAMVDPKAYAPLCRSIAARGLQVHIFKMPWRMASLGYNKPEELGLFKDNTKTYILIGHSQGAKMAAQFVFENPSYISKLILMGTTHPRDIDMSALITPILKISGSMDGVASLRDVMANKAMLPDSTKFATIEGGNHAQFGYYGFQLGDNRASISREAQQKLILEKIMNFIGSTAKDPNSQNE